MLHLIAGYLAICAILGVNPIAPGDYPYEDTLGPSLAEIAYSAASIVEFVRDMIIG